MLNYINLLKNKKIRKSLTIASDPYFQEFYRSTKKLRSLCMQDQTFVI